MSTISIQDIKKELNQYVTDNKNVVSAGVYSNEISINKYCTTITKVQGNFPQFHGVLSNVVQGFKAEWQQLGEAQFKSKMLKNFQQKVNYGIVPDEIQHTYLAYLFTENKRPEDMPISKWIMEELMLKVIDNLEDLSQMAEFDATKLDEYGYSLDGIAKQVETAIGHAEHPAFKIPLNALTPANILTEFKKLERGIPKKQRRKIKRIFVSDNILLMYADAYEQEYGTKVTYKDNDVIKTPLLKIELVGLNSIPDTCIFATVEGNMARLIDVFDKPAVTDIQVQDYLVKIFMRFWLGYDFLINQLVYVAVFDGSDRGLGIEAQNKLYYESENLVVTP